MDAARHRRAVDLETRVINSAIFILIFAVHPVLLSPAGRLIPTNPAPGMTPTAFRAIEIAGRCFMAFNILSIFSALAAVLVPSFGRTPVRGVVRAERVSVKLLKIAIFSMMLSFEFLFFIRLSPDSLLSGFCIIHGVLMCCRSLLLIKYLSVFMNDY